VSCTACDMGKYANGSGVDRCRYCPPGRFAEHVASHECLTCAISFSTPRGATRAVDCRCAQGMIFMQGQCRSCPVGLTCPGGFSEVDVGFNQELLTDDTTSLRPGYMSLPDAPLRIFECPTYGGCAGTRSPYNTSAICNDRYALEPGCVQCAEGWYSRANEPCSKCDSSKVSLLLSVVATVASNSIFTVYLHQRFNRPQAPLLITYTQLALLIQRLGILSSFSVEYPEPLRTLMAFSDLAVMNLGSVFQYLPFQMGPLELDCILPGVIERTLVTLALPLLWIANLCVLALVSEAILGHPVSRDCVLNTIGRILMIFFVGITSSTLSHFHCHEHPGGQLTLARHYAVVCYSSTWYEMLPAVMLAAIVYTVAFPAAVIYVVWVAPRSYASDPSFRIRYRFLFGIFTAERFYWSIWLMVSGLGLNLIQVMFRFGQSQLYTLVFWVGMCAICSAEKLPFKYMYCNHTALALDLCLIMVGVLSTSFQKPLPQDQRDYLNSNLAAIMVTVLGCCGCLLAAFTVFEIRRSYLTHEGVKRGSRVAFGIRLRDVMVICCLLPNARFNHLLAELSDHDWQNLQSAVKVLLASVLRLQPGASLRQQRLIPGATEHAVATDAKIRELLESQAGQVLHLRPWQERVLLQRFMQELRRVGAGSPERSRRGQAKDSVVDAAMSTSPTRSFPSAQRSFSGGVAVGVEQAKDRLQSLLVNSELRQRFSALDPDGPGTLTLEAFLRGARRLELAFSSSELEDIFHICDFDGSGELTLSEFISAATGMSSSLKDGGPAVIHSDSGAALQFDCPLSPGIVADGWEEATDIWDTIYSFGVDGAGDACCSGEPEAECAPDNVCVELAFDAEALRGRAASETGDSPDRPPEPCGAEAGGYCV